MTEKNSVPVVCAVILSDENKVLATQRPLSKHLGGLWEFPGGKVEPNESEVEALSREIMEELQVSISVYQPLTLVTHEYDTFIIHLYPFICRVYEGNLAPTEHNLVRWLRVSDLDQVKWAPADCFVLHELRNINLATIPK